MSGNYKYNLVKIVAQEKLPGNCLLLFQEPENPFFLRNRFLLATTGFAFFLHLFGNKREVGIVFLGNGNLPVMVRGWLRYGRTRGS